MARTRSATATILQFPVASPRPLTFSQAERQALLALAYAVPGAGVDIAADHDGDEYCSLGAANFEEGAWWTVLVTAKGFDVVNFAGYRVGRFAAVGPLVKLMRPHMAYMLGVTAPGADTPAAASGAAGPRPLTIV